MLSVHAPSAGISRAETGSERLTTPTSDPNPALLGFFGSLLAGLMPTPAPAPAPETMGVGSAEVDASAKEEDEAEEKGGAERHAEGVASGAYGAFSIGAARTAATQTATPAPVDAPPPKPSGIVPPPAASVKPDAEGGEPGEGTTVTSSETVEAPSAAAGLVIPDMGAPRAYRPTGRNAVGSAAGLDRARRAASGAETEEAESTGPTMVKSTLPASPAQISGSSSDLGSDPESDGGNNTRENFQSVVVQELGNGEKPVGIEAAKATNTMTAHLDNSPAATPARSVESAVVRTIERVAEAAEMMQASSRSSVQLRLDFPGSGPLHVKVSLRGNEVLAEFRSDSAGVRDALSAAWNDFGREGLEHGLVLGEIMVRSVAGVSPITSSAPPSSQPLAFDLGGQGSNAFSDQTARDPRSDAAVTEGQFGSFRRGRAASDSIASPVVSSEVDHLNPAQLRAFA